MEALLWGRCRIEYRRGREAKSSGGMGGALYMRAREQGECSSRPEVEVTGERRCAAVRWKGGEADRLLSIKNKGTPERWRVEKGGGIFDLAQSKTRE